MKRELRLREVQVLDTARKNFIETAERDHKEKLNLLEEEVGRTKIRRKKVDLSYLARLIISQIGSPFFSFNIYKADSQIKKKALLRDLETKSAIEEVALKELEIESQKGFLQQELARLTGPVSFSDLN